MRNIIQYPKSSYQSLPGLLQPNSLRVFRGVNRLDSFSIAEEFASDMKNLSSSGYPALSNRPGYSVLGGAIGTKVLGLGVWKDKELHAVFNDGTWRRWTGSAWSSPLASGLNTMVPWTFTNFQGNLADINLIGSNGVDSIKRYDGSSVVNLANAPAGGNFITTYQNRLWCAVDTTLHGSALDQPEQWSLFNGDDSDSYFKEIESPVGEKINALKGGLSKLVIGMPNSIHILFGGIPSDFETKAATLDMGVLNNRAADTVNGIMSLVYSKGIYEYGGGTLPENEFSEVVQEFIDRMNTAGAPNVCVGTDEDKLYVSLPITGATPDTLLEYDARAGVQAWNIWKDISAVCFARMAGDMYVGDAAGRVLKLGGSSDAGTPIAWHWISKPFGAGSLAQLVRWYRMWLVVDLPAGSMLEVYLSKSASGDSDWTLVQAVGGSPVIQSTRIIIPVTTVANANWVRVKIAGTGPVKIHEFTRQLREMPIV